MGNGGSNAPRNNVLASNAYNAKKAPSSKTDLSAPPVPKPIGRAGDYFFYLLLFILPTVNIPVFFLLFRTSLHCSYYEIVNFAICFQNLKCCPISEIWVHLANLVNTLAVINEY